MYLYLKYYPVVIRTAYRILCDMRLAEKVTHQVFRIFRPVKNGRPGNGVRIMRLTCRLCRIMILTSKASGNYIRELFVCITPNSTGYDDYIVQQAWELYCRATFRMTPLQRTVFSLHVLEGLPEEMCAVISDVMPYRIDIALSRARSKIIYELGLHGRSDDYQKYISFVRLISADLHNSLHKDIPCGE